MNKLLLLFLLTASTLMGVDIPVQTSEMRSFGESINVNAQIIQLNNTLQSVMPLVDGHIKKYYVKSGQKVKANQKIALIDSIILSDMTAEYLSLKKQYKVLEENYAANKQLYNKGMLALQELNRQAIEKDSINSKLNKLESQLLTLGIKAQTLTQVSSEYTLYSQSGGIINEILQPLHSVVGAKTPIVSIVKENALYVKAYIPLRYADALKLGQKGETNLSDQSVNVTLTQILPEVDPQTQRIIALFAIDNTLEGPHINAFVPLTVYLTVDKKYVAVKTAALSFFQNEWVVFVPKKMKKRDEDRHDEDSDIPNYEVRVVKIITQDKQYTAVKGIESGEKYVSDKSYYVKSMLLKSSFGDND